MSWELGTGMGHIDRMLLAARELRAGGHEVVFALKDLVRAWERVVAEGFEALQSPVWLPRMAQAPRLSTYAYVLASAGWLDPHGLAGLMHAWRALFRAVAPDIVIADHAPTALLSARWCGQPRAAIGNGFELPPLQRPLPAMRYWDADECARAAHSDEFVLRPVREAQRMTGDTPLRDLAALFADTPRLLACLPELTHYPDYGDLEPLGPCYVGDRGVPPQWPDGQRRAFIYMNAEHAALRPLVAALTRRGCAVLLHARGLTQADVQALGTGVRVETRPVRIDDVMRDADIVINHGSAGTVAAVALAGRPQWMFPNHLEQYMLARRARDAGVGLLSEPGSPLPDVERMLDRLFDDADLRESCERFARRHAGASTRQTGCRMADGILRALAR